MAFKLKKQKAQELWSSGKTLKIKGKEYSVNKMSYGQFFLEPKGKELSETQGFAKETIFLEEQPIKNKYGYQEKILIEEK